MALGPTNRLVFLQRKTVRKPNPPVRSERPPEARSARQSTMILAVSRGAKARCSRCSPERIFSIEFWAEYGGCGRRDAHLAAIRGDRGGLIYNDRCNDFSIGIVNASSLMVVGRPSS